MQFRYPAIAFLAALVAAPAIADDQSPKDLVAQIYRISAGPKGDYRAPSGFDDKQIRKHFTKSLLALQKAMDQRSKKLNEPILDFDPVTNSQDPSVVHLAIDVESADAAKTIVAASFDREDEPKHNVVCYIFVREDNAWKLDDMRGEEAGDAWNLRDIMSPKRK